MVLVVGLGLTSDRNPQDLAATADISQFNPGNIISDSVFYNPATMSSSAIDGFIDLKEVGCRAGSDGTPCLKDFRQNTTARSADAYCNGYAAGAGESAGVIIAKVAVSCGVNPQVLLVLLQKEQGLVLASGSSLTSSRYRIATGFGCPDTAACDSTYYGFQNQLYSAARQFKLYAANPTAYGFRAGRTNWIQWSPNASCGSGAVYIVGQATAGLYNYTPYQPNAAALAAGYGSGDACSAYGNRNFWLYFTDWFGSTQDPGQSAWQPIGHLDAVSGLAGDRVEAQGWTVDPDTALPIAVHVYVDGTFTGAFAANVSRPDIAQMLPAYGDQHGFDVTVGVTPGAHTVCAYGINVGAPAINPSLGCMSVDTGDLPLGNVEAAVVDEGQALVTGWALDLQSTDPLAVHVYVNGQLGGYGTADVVRTDVAAKYPGAGAAHGFSIRANLRPGSNQVCVYAIDPPGNGYNPLLGCQSLYLQVDPFGSLELVQGGASTVSVVGWALDPETRSPIDVHVFLDGVDSATGTAGQTRTDVANAFPAFGASHGFAFSVPATPGDRQVCVNAWNVKQGTTNTQLGCRTVNVGVAPVGHLDQVTATAFQAQIYGWALDGDTSSPITVQLTVDGKSAGTVTAGDNRPDIATAFPATGAAHGFSTQLSLAAGRHVVCATAVNVMGGSGNPSLGCLAVDVATGRSLPFGMLEGVSFDSGITRVSGWVIEPDAPTTPVMTHFYVDGKLAGYLTAGDPRPDVAAAYPGAGPAHGYTGSLILPAGRHTICTYGINTGAGSINPTLGCSTVTVP